ncbi:katanin p60 ATPase-containing subunit A-like 2 X2 [Biomphalaria glabrata]|nr:Biomphalaria glabrata katanin p60 ATPase-containing subunit A-like 2; transcript variant X2 [Biomphalaria glabrata]
MIYVILKYYGREFSQNLTLEFPLTAIFRVEEFKFRLFLPEPDDGLGAVAEAAVGELVVGMSEGFWEGM